MYNPNPDIENTIITQPLGTPSDSKKCLNTNKVSTNFIDSLYVPIDRTLFCISISGLGYKLLYLLILIPGISMSQTDEKILNEWTLTNESKLIEKYQLIKSQWFESECLLIAQQLKFKQVKQCKLFDSNIINAYVFNNGHVYFSKGMMDQINNRHQWAAILAHENAHVELRHYLKMLKKIKNPGVFFPKSKIKKMMKNHEMEADTWSESRLYESNMDYSQTYYFLLRIINITNKESRQRIKLSKRIKKSKNKEIYNKKLIKKIKSFSN